ncbi:competence type IV pilus minor pilin ComGF [Lysinibacillus sp. NPDC097287]|uniref:competence type IV pilus minor pilin ComGF n=1 Tax=Lysinibacillus sp. NPDC097287 TaxID=3364144 RepID=UPI0037F493F5
MNERGYTLLEALFQLVVFVIFSHIFILIMLWFTEMKSTVLANEHTKWELFVYDMNMYFVDVTSFEVDETNSKITFQTTDGLYSMERYHNIIRKQVSNFGHEPLLIGIKTCKFFYENEELRIVVEFPNGISKERTYYVPIKEK